jgi:hypothetical protein
MKRINVKNAVFLILFAGVFAACNNTADTPEERMDSLRRDSMERVNNPPIGVNDSLRRLILTPNGFRRCWKAITVK